MQHYYEEPYRYFGQKVAVIGGRNSAVEAALDLYRHGAAVTLLHRGTALSEGVKYWILPDIQNRIRQGQVAALFSATVLRIGRGRLTVEAPGGEQELAADFYWACAFCGTCLRSSSTITIVALNRSCFSCDQSSGRENLCRKA